MRVQASIQLLFKTSGTERLQWWRSRRHLCSSTDGGASFGSQSHSPPGRRRCRGHRPYCLAALHPSCQEGNAPAPLACAWGGSWLLEKPPNAEQAQRRCISLIFVLVSMSSHFSACDKLCRKSLEVLAR